MTLFNRTTSALAILLVSGATSANSLVIETSTAGEPGVAAILFLGLAGLIASRRVVANA